MGDAETSPQRSLIKPSSASSVDAFFHRCGLPISTRDVCHSLVEQKFPSQAITPLPAQGYCSYTILVGGRLVVQFRPEKYKLDLAITTAAKVVYGRYAPKTNFLAVLKDQNLLAYVMDRVDGISYKEFCYSLQPGLPSLPQLRTLAEDLALFLSRSWHQRKQKTVQDLPKGLVGSSLRPRLHQLSLSLPTRFQATTRHVLQDLHLIEALPWTLTHGDLLQSNILLNPSTSHITGIVDWAEAEILPFGTCFYGLDELLGSVTPVPSTINDGKFGMKFVYRPHPHAEIAHAAFYEKLYLGIPELAAQTEQGFALRKAVALARVMGILLWHGIAFDDGRVKRVVSEQLVEDLREIAYLDGLLLDVDLEKPAAIARSVKL